MAEQSPYEVYAVRYAHNPNARRANNFIGGDPHDGPMPLDYFVWAIKGPAGTFVFDTGFDAAMGEKRDAAVPALPRGRTEGGRCGTGGRAGRHPVAHALRSLRQLRSVPAGSVSSAGHRDGVLHRPVHVPCRAARAVRGGGCRRHRAQAVRRARACFTTVRRSWRPGCRCITSVAIRKACRWCGCGRSAAGWCWRRMPATSTPIWRKAGRSRSCTATRIRWPAMQRCGELASAPNAIIPGHDPLVLARYPAAKVGAGRDRGAAGRRATVVFLDAFRVSRVARDLRQERAAVDMDRLAGDEPRLIGA